MIRILWVYTKLSINTFYIPNTQNPKPNLENILKYS